MTRPRVSVVCPFFNAEIYLAEAIESVLAQDYSDFELLLVDDGSTDRSTSIAADYAARESERIFYLEHPGHQNRGATASRNAGLRAARGELVAFIDSDDRWRPSKLREQVDVLDREGVDAVCGAVNFWSSHAGGQDRVVPTGHAANRPVAPPEALLEVYPLGKADPPCPSDLLMRRSIVDAISGFEEEFTGPLQLYEDQAFLAKFFLEGTIYFDERVWLDYRLHDTSCTAQVNRAALQPAIRRYCLEWFENYVRGTRHRHNPRVRLAVMRALRPYRHPHLTAAGRRVKSFLRKCEPV
jgi:glycosyltransferase involved in cell wall biosynthesis